ncbi:MAG: hypothetical protein R3D62_00345 [Xanthobacteraceae bacterium]
MVDADHRVADAGQEALRKSARHFAAHDMVRERGRRRACERHDGRADVHETS